MLKKILIVDDEPDIIEFLTYNLEKSGYCVASCLNRTDSKRTMLDLQVMDLVHGFNSKENLSHSCVSELFLDPCFFFNDRISNVVVPSLFP